MSAQQDRRDKIASRAVQIGFVIALIGFWYVGTAYWGVSRILLPNPVNVWHELKLKRREVEKPASYSCT